MALLELALALSPWAKAAALATALATALVASYLYAFFVTHAHLHGIPGPVTARFSNLWLLVASRRGVRSHIVDEAHRRYGKVVRIQPNHVSIKDDVDAIGAIYGHGNGFLKSDFYDPFLSIRPGLFSTRSRSDHARKRKIISHTLSARSVLEFEPYMRESLRLFVARLDGLVSASAARTPGGAPEARLNCLLWFNLLAFDIISDLAFGKTLGMLEAGADLAEVKAKPGAPSVYLPAVDILNRRGDVNATLGCLPALVPYADWLPDPFYRRGVDAVRNLAGMAIACVEDRIKNPPAEQRTDLLARLMQGRDAAGQPLGRDELTAEALTQLIAGSDTTANSSCALMNYLACSPSAMATLQRELDAAIPADVDVPTYAMIRDLPYLGYVVQETLRHHSTSSLGLPRLVPPGSPGVTILGHHFPAGTVLSVPTYSIHHSPEIWGPDVAEFRPERWEAPTPRQRNAFIPFSHGPRACIGRNVAEMEVRLIAATWAHRYNVALKQGDMETHEGFLRKPVGLCVGLSRRQT